MKSPLRDESGMAHPWLDELTPEEFEEYERRFRWIANQARPEQLTPPGDWKTWLLLAGRGFGKTRTAAEDVAAYGLDTPGAHIGVVAETFSDGRDVCIEGESGLLSCLPRSSIKHWNRSIGELFLNNRTKYKVFSGDKPDGMRGYQHHRMWWDELAKFLYPDEAWNQGQLGLRSGRDPRNVVTTTPRPIPLIRDLVERENVVVTSGSTFDNAENLAESFLDEVRRQYEGTKLGDQELHGKIVDLDGESIFKREWWNLAENRYDPEDTSLWNRTVARWASLDTAETKGETSAYSALTVGDLQPDYRMPLRYVARERLEFPELVEWTISEVAPFAYDRKLRGLLIENASSGRQLIQTLRASGPKWLRGLIVPIKPMVGNATASGKEQNWRAASVWAKRSMMPLPYPHPNVEWLHTFEEEFFAVPNARYFDQADSASQLINHVERVHAAFSQRWRKLQRAA
jgi:phage terminase large subunit-like protein